VENTGNTTLRYLEIFNTGTEQRIILYRRLIHDCRSLPRRQSLAVVGIDSPGGGEGSPQYFRRNLGAHVQDEADRGLKLALAL
jgi:hypothetical protein